MAPAQDKKPNILAIFGDDIGIPQISAYTMGMMGYRTPNIDRIAREGALFTDSYGQQSCTAGRASFILGQEPFRTGLLTIGIPGDPHGITPWMPTIADVLKAQGYAPGQFGKNHHDGYNFMPYFQGKEKAGPRDAIYYFDQGGNLNTIRWDDWKASFAVLKGNIGTATRDVTIAELLSGAGYRTGHFGKWHLGSDDGQLPNVKASTSGGIVAQTRMGRALGDRLERAVLGRVPGFLKSMTRDMVGLGTGTEVAAALARIEEAWVPSFVLERHASGLFTVFVPSAPTPLAGAIYDLTADRVKLLDVPTSAVVACIMRLGVGSRALLERAALGQVHMGEGAAGGETVSG